MNCGNEMKMKKWSSPWTQFMQLTLRAGHMNPQLTCSQRQLHKLRSLRRSFLHFHFISAVHIWFISDIINIAILTNSSTLISKITVAKLKLVLRWSFRVFPYDFTVKTRSFHSFLNFKFNRSRNGFKGLYAYFKDHLENLYNAVSANFEASHDSWPRPLI